MHTTRVPCWMRAFGPTRQPPLRCGETPYVSVHQPFVATATVSTSQRWCQLLPDLPDKPRQPLFVPPQSGLRRLPMVPSPLAGKELTRLRVSWVDGLLGVVLWLSRQAACALT